VKEDEIYEKLLQQKEFGLLLGVSEDLDTIVAAHEARDHNQQAQQHKASSYKELLKHCGACMQIEGRDNFAVDKRVNEHTEGLERGLVTKTTAHVVIEYEEGGGVEIIAGRSEDADEDMQTAENFAAQWKEGHFRNCCRDANSVASNSSATGSASASLLLWLLQILLLPRLLLPVKLLALLLLCLQILKVLRSNSNKN